MSENLELEKQLKLVKKTGSYVVGRREVSTSLKGSKLLVWSGSASLPQVILDECKNLSVPAIKFAGNPVELGRACGIPFRVSVIALKTVGDADLSGFAKSSDYYSGVASPSTTVEDAAKEESKPKKETKKKDGPKAEKAKRTKKSESEAEDKKSAKKSDSKSASKKNDEKSKPKKSSRKTKKSVDEEEEN